MKVGDLVTATGWDELRWVGVIAEVLRCECVVIRSIGGEDDRLHAEDPERWFRLLTDAEARDILTGLTLTPWTKDGSWLSRGDDQRQQPWVYITANGAHASRLPPGAWEWGIWLDETIGSMCSARGHCPTLEEAQGCAAREVLRRMCEGTL